jgi:hypothetical protein
MKLFPLKQITYADCEEGDLADHFKALNPKKAAAIDEHIVQERGCAGEEQYLVEKPHATEYITITEESGRKQVAGEGIHFLPPDINKPDADEAFRALIKGGCTNADGTARDCIIHRFCDSCSLESHCDIYSKHLTTIPDAGD